MICGLPGEERPAVAGRFKVDMGGVRKAVHTDRCPWAMVMADRLVTPLLSAYGILERWGEWPPGRRDPRLMEGLVIIASEHNRMDAELIPNPKNK